MPPTAAAGDAGTKFSALLALMAKLRSDDGYPWDREQTHASLKPYLLEETYELLEALQADDDDAIAEELGDVLLQVIFHAQIAAEAGRFSMADVIHTLEQKLIRRHPHVFGDADAVDAEAVVRTWTAVKREEQAQASDSVPASLLGSIPRALPALVEAEKVQQRAARVGFQWDDISGAWQKIIEELDELRHAAQNIDGTSADREAVQRDAVADELGDVLFAVVNVARYLGVDPEQSLRATNAKFRQRFRYIEKAAHAQGRTPDNMTLAEMDALWDEAKRDT